MSDVRQNIIIEDPTFEIVVLAKNARINTNHKIVQVLAELENVEWDVVLFSETRAAKGNVILDGGHALYTNIGDNAFAGVGILLHAKHVNKSNRIYNVSGRVLALDFVVNGKRVRSIAVYVPHCGYSAQALEETYEQLRCSVSEAQKSKRRIIIGGDFNTCLKFGTRGILLEQFSKEFGLCISNGTIPETNDDWTFRSSMGIKRRLDYILSSNSFTIRESGPRDLLDLGSDHRVVRAVLATQKRRTRSRIKRVQMKGWLPNIDSDGMASKYEEVLQERMGQGIAMNVENLNSVMYEAAISPGVSFEAPVIQKPWQPEEIQDLIRKRLFVLLEQKELRFRN